VLSIAACIVLGRSDLAAYLTEAVMLDDYFQLSARCDQGRVSMKPAKWSAYGLELGAEGFDAIGPVSPSPRISE
jgi:hypothetical protein